METRNTSDIKNLGENRENKGLYFLYFLDTRTINSLQKMNIFSIGSLWNNRNTFLNRRKIKTNSYGYGIGKKGLKEIIKAIDLIKDNLVKGDDTISNQDDSIEEHETKEFINYIPVKLNGGNGKISLRERNGYIELNNYLNNLGDTYENFTIKDYCNIFYENLTYAEKEIFNNRLLYGKDCVKKEKLEMLAEKTNITRERIRQLEGKLIEKIELSMESVGKSEIGKHWTKRILSTNGFDSYGILKASNIGSEKFSSLFILKVFELIFKGADFGSAIFEEDLSILVYDKNLYNDYVIKQRFNNIDELYNEERIEKIQYTKDELLIRITMPNTSLLKEYGYEYCILNYLFYKYFICDLGGYFVFQGNKKNLGALVVKEIESIGKPIHFRELTKIMMDKYPEFNRNEGKVHAALSKYCKYVGPGIFVSKDHEMKGGFISDIAESYLEKKGEPISFKKMEEYILKNAIVEKGSIRIRLTDDSRFIVEDGEIYLRKRKTENTNSSKPEITMNNLNEEGVVYDLLKGTDGLSFDEICEKLNMEGEIIKSYLVKLYKNKKIGYSIKNNKTVYNVLLS